MRFADVFVTSASTLPRGSVSIQYLKWRQQHRPDRGR
jgi:hypothetical protein